MNQKNLKILDCTFRDGGYYNNWNFEDSLIVEYLNACSKAKIDIVEIGFRFKNKKKGYGPLAFTDEKYLQKINFPKNMLISVMINANEFIEDDDIEMIKSIKDSFIPKKKSIISIVRVAINFNTYDKGKTIVKTLSQLGYKVGFNLMQSQNKKVNEIYDVINSIKKWKCIDYLYFADSIGVMDPKYVDLFIKALKNKWKNSPIGIHAHNNKSLAFINSMQALMSGASMIDCTILGMGRGAGNTPTETLLLELENNNYHYRPSHLVDILPKFTRLLSKYKWGPNYFYHFAAINNIHPTYIQKLLTDTRYSDDQIKLALTNLSQNKSNFFIEDNLKLALYNKKSYIDNYDAKNFFNKKTICIVGSGSSGIKLKEKIVQFIKKNKPIVLSLNINPYIDEKLIDYYVSCYEYRVFFDAPQYQKIEKPIIMPYSVFKNHLKEKFNTNQIIDYGLKLKKNCFNIYNKYCELDSPLAINYALAICSIGNAKKIYLAFIDGYEDDINQNNVLNNAIKKFKLKNQNIKMRSITPTLLKIDE